MLQAFKFDIKNRPWLYHPNAVNLFRLCWPEDEQSRINKVAGKVLTEEVTIPQQEVHQHRYETAFAKRITSTNGSTFKSAWGDVDVRPKTLAMKALYWPCRP